GYGASNEGEIEIGGVADGSQSVVITSALDDPLLAGEEVEIAGEGFSANPAENDVRIVADDGVPAKAEVLAVTGVSLRLRVPFGAGTGKLWVIRGTSDASVDVKLRTSISGFIETDQRRPIAGAKVSLVGTPIERLSDTDGSFVLPDTPAGSQIVLIVPPPGSTYPTEPVKIEVRAGRDNQLTRGVELARSGATPFPLLGADAGVDAGIDVGRGGFLTPQSPEAVLTFLLPGRTPVNSAAGHFSTAIAQITPFGQPISPAAKLSFPNRDAIPVGEKPRLFKFDPNLNSPTVGSFVDVGEATVSADGQRVETAAGAIAEGSYYFVSLKRSTGAINGRVVERDGRPVPRAIVQVRGQSSFTDGHGGFVLREVPVMRAGDRVSVEVSYQRPDGSVSRKESETVEIVAGGLATINSEIVLDAPVANFPPAILAPSHLNLNAGETRDFDFAVTDAAPSRVALSGSAAAFTTLTEGQGTYRLRMSPSVEGSFNLTINADSAVGASAQIVAVTVNKADNNAPAAQEQSLTTLEDTAKQITLSARDPNGRTLTYSIVTPPSRGTLSGSPPNLIYTPGRDFNGVDSFEFKAGNGVADSRAAKLFIVIRPVNDAPVLSLTGAREINAGETLNLLISASDVDAQPLTLTVAGKPAEATVTEVTSTSWRFNWTPLALQAGSYKLSFKVEDNGSPPLSGAGEFAFTIRTPDLTKSKWAKTFALEGGSITGMVVGDPGLFAATDGGGVYLSLNQGQSWAPVNEGLGNLFVTGLARDGNRLFAGTTNGLFTSDNNGRTWRLSAFDRLSVRKLAAAAGKVYAWTSAEEFYSSDNGANWKRLRPDLPRFNGGIVSLGIVVANDGTIYAQENVGPPYRQVLLRLRSGEQLWQRIEAGLPPTAVTQFALEGFVAYGKTLVYSAQEYNSPRRWFLSFDQGDRWEEINPRQRDYGGQVQSLFVFQGKLFLDLSGSGLVVSSDNGRTWQLQPIGTFSYSTSVSTMLSVGGTLFAGLQGYYYSQDNGVGIGVFRSTDSGRNWDEVNTGLTNGGTIPALVTSEMDIYVPASWNLLTSDKEGQSWRKLNQALPQALRLYRGGGYQNGMAAGGKALIACCGSEYVSGRGHNFLFLSADSGQNWKEIGWQSLDLEFPSKALAVRENTLYAGGFGEVMVSNDLGHNWQAVRDGLKNNRDVTHLLVDGGNVYAVTFGAGETSLIGNIYLLGNQGKSWTEIGPKNVEQNEFTAFAASGDNLFAGTDEGLIYASLDQGRNWKVFDGGLPKERVRNLVVIDNKVFAATDNGVYFSSDNGQSWMPFTLGMTDTRITSLVKRGAVLYAGTEGGSIFRLEADVQIWSQSNAGLTNTFTNAIALGKDNLFVGTLGSGVFRSGNGGRTWAASSAGLRDNANVSSLAVSPTGEATVWAGLFGDGVYRSDNQGATWTAFNAGLGNKLVNTLLADGAALYAGTDGGVFRSVAGEGWTALNNGLSTLRVISLKADGGTLYAGTDGGGVFKLVGGSWVRASNGLTNQSVTALFVNQGVIYAGTGGGGVFISRNGGATWTAANNQLPPVLNVYAFAVSGRRLYAGTVYGVFFTEDEGRNWKQANAGLLDVYVTGLAVSGNTLFASTVRGGFFTSAIP
ncbi:MAG TPA: Ig-like domain-containing protein, partial [Blastocatellia bacterium]|nr:Ig-like domain-containing protein [Blastocatellia bacterium]